MKLFIPLFFLLAYSCTRSQNTTKTTSAFTKDSVIVYGNVHMVPADIVPPAILATIMDTVTAVQHILHSAVTEDIILVEGFALDSQITLNHYIEMAAAENLKITPENMEYIKRSSADYEVQTLFILEQQKIIFGAENKALYDSVYRVVQADPTTAWSKDMLDARSAAIERNACAVARTYGRRVAVILGYNHLAWFQEHGYPIYNTLDSLRHH